MGYTSRSTGRVMEVFIEKISKLRREVTFTFVEDRQTWKCLPFSMVLGSGSPLVPLTRGLMHSVQTRASSSTAPVKQSNTSSSPAVPEKDTKDTPRKAPVAAPEPAKEETSRPAPVKPAPPQAAPLVGRLADKAIPDSAITASSYFMKNPRHGLGQMWRTRIDNTDNAWRAAVDDISQCVRWNLGSMKRITKVQTKGNVMEPYWVKQFQISHSADGNTWTRVDRRFTGNCNKDGLAEHEFTQPLLAQYVRIHPLAWNEHISLRAELFGFDGKVTEQATEEEQDQHGDTGRTRERSRSRSRSR